MSPQWKPFNEPVHVTLVRNVSIALIVGAVLARSLGGLKYWPFATLIALWPSLGGHLVEIWYLNWLRPRIYRDRPVQVATRIGVWFVGGICLTLAMNLTAMTFGFHLVKWANLWLGGLGFICIELVAHLMLSLRGRPNFYDGQG